MPVGRSPLLDAIYLEPGKHVVEVKSVGYVARRDEITANAGAVTTLRIDLLREGAAAPPPVAPPPGTGPVTPPPPDGPDGEGPALWPGFVIGGAGLAVLGAGIGVFAAGSSASSSADEAFAAVAAAGGSCEPASGPGSERCAAVQDDVDSAKTLAPLGGVMMGVGGAALVGGVVYVIGASAADGAAAESGFTPWVGPGTAGGSFSGRF